MAIAMNEVPSPVFAFLPCHNRRSITMAFLEHLYSSWPSGVPLIIHLLDDGSTDGTSDSVRSRWPQIFLHHLDGRQFWGGALNTIQSLLKDPLNLDLDPEADPWVMVVNDDLQFPQGSLERAISLLPCSDVLAPTIQGGSGRVSFDSTKGRFLEHNSYGPSNLAITMATFLRRSTWLQAEPIPKGIPHYLSDYWFTHSLSCKGFKIITVPEFSVICRTDTTRFSGPSSTSFQARLAYWRSCLDPRSPDYLPASIVFRKRFSKEPYKFFSLFVLRLKILVYSALTGYRPGKIADLQA
jgi:GT2 family glycosyltransferase